MEINSNIDGNPNGLLKINTKVVKSFECTQEMQTNQASMFINTDNPCSIKTLNSRPSPKAHN